jgi:predicted nucleic acid-binding protein
LFDTGVIVDFLVGDKKVQSFFDEYVFSGQLTPVISAQTLAELFMAARNKREETELEQWLSKVFDVCEVSALVAKEAGLLKRGNGIRAGDTTIAATASVLKIPLVTTTPELYRRAEIRTFKPFP